MYVHVLDQKGKTRFDNDLAADLQAGDRMPTRSSCLENTRRSAPRRHATMRPDQRVDD
jgi:hypothetical protein